MPAPLDAESRRRIERLLKIDPWLQPYAGRLAGRQATLQQRRAALAPPGLKLASAGRAHHYFGLQAAPHKWIFREWAPNATAVYLIGDFSDWQVHPQWRLQPTAGQDGVWEIEVPAERLAHQMLYRLRIDWPGGSGDRIPAYARRVVQDPETLIFNAQIWAPPQPYQWQHEGLSPPPQPILIYESHVGMAQDREGIGTYREFADEVLPRIVRAGYNTVQ